MRTVTALAVSAAAVVLSPPEISLVHEVTQKDNKKHDAVAVVSDKKHDKKHSVSKEI